MRKYLILLLLIVNYSLFINKAEAQELLCRVSVQPPQGEADQQVYKTLETAAQDFLNTNRWTNDVFDIAERIQCNVNIVINNRAGISDFEASILVQSKRPVFNSTYESVMLNYNDRNFKFQYTEFEPLIHNENAFSGNLSAVLAYYAYIIIGMDYDSFSLYGGTPYYQKAQAIVNAAQNSPFEGWRANEGLVNRHWLIENLMNNNYQPIRKSIYDYHRLGLDAMHQDVNKARLKITEALKEIQKSHKRRSGSMSMLQQIYMNAKVPEIVGIYTKALPNEKGAIIPILNEIDGVNSSKYAEINR